MAAPVMSAATPAADARAAVAVHTVSTADLFGGHTRPLTHTHTQAHAHTHAHTHTSAQMEPWKITPAAVASPTLRSDTLSSAQGMTISLTRATDAAAHTPVSTFFKNTHAHTKLHTHTAAHSGGVGFVQRSAADRMVDRAESTPTPRPVERTVSAAEAVGLSPSTFFSPNVVRAISAPELSAHTLSDRRTPAQENAQVDACVQGDALASPPTRVDRPVPSYGYEGVHETERTRADPHPHEHAQADSHEYGHAAQGAHPQAEPQSLIDTHASMRAGTEPQTSEYEHSGSASQPYSDAHGETSVQYHNGEDYEHWQDRTGPLHVESDVEARQAEALCEMPTRHAGSPLAENDGMGMAEVRASAAPLTSDMGAAAQQPQPVDESEHCHAHADCPAPLHVLTPARADEQCMGWEDNNSSSGAACMPSTSRPELQNPPAPPQCVDVDRGNAQSPALVVQYGGQPSQPTVAFHTEAAEPAADIGQSATQPSHPRSSDGNKDGPPQAMASHEQNVPEQLHAAPPPADSSSTCTQAPAFVPSLMPLASGTLSSKRRRQPKYASAVPVAAPTAWMQPAGAAPWDSVGSPVSAPLSQFGLNVNIPQAGEEPCAYDAQSREGTEEAASDAAPDGFQPPVLLPPSMVVAAEERADAVSSADAPTAVVSTPIAEAVDAPAAVVATPTAEAVQCGDAAAPCAPASDSMLAASSMAEVICPAPLHNVPKVPAAELSITGHALTPDVAACVPSDCGNTSWELTSADENAHTEPAAAVQPVLEQTEAASIPAEATEAGAFSDEDLLGGSAARESMAASSTCDAPWSEAPITSNTPTSALQIHCEHSEEAGDKSLPLTETTPPLPVAIENVSSMLDGHDGVASAAHESLPGFQLVEPNGDRSPLQYSMIVNKPAATGYITGDGVIPSDDHPHLVVPERNEGLCAGAMLVSTPSMQMPATHRSDETQMHSGLANEQSALLHHDCGDTPPEQRAETNAGGFDGTLRMDGGSTVVHEGMATTGWVDGGSCEAGSDASRDPAVDTVHRACVHREATRDVDPSCRGAFGGHEPNAMGEHQHGAWPGPNAEKAGMGGQFAIVSSDDTQGEPWITPELQSVPTLARADGDSSRLSATPNRDELPGTLGNDIPDGRAGEPRCEFTVGAGATTPPFGELDRMAAQDEFVSPAESSAAGSPIPNFVAGVAPSTDLARTLTFETDADSSAVDHQEPSLPTCQPDHTNVNQLSAEQSVLASGCDEDQGRSDGDMEALPERAGAGYEPQLDMKPDNALAGVDGTTADGTIKSFFGLSAAVGRDPSEDPGLVDAKAVCAAMESAQPSVLFSTVYCSPSAPSAKWFAAAGAAAWTTATHQPSAQFESAGGQLQSTAHPAVPFHAFGSRGLRQRDCVASGNADSMSGYPAAQPHAWPPSEGTPWGGVTAGAARKNPWTDSAAPYMPPWSTSASTQQATIAATGGVPWPDSASVQGQTFGSANAWLTQTETPANLAADAGARGSWAEGWMEWLRGNSGNAIHQSNGASASSVDVGTAVGTAAFALSAAGHKGFGPTSSSDPATGAGLSGWEQVIANATKPDTSWWNIVRDLLRGGVALDMLDTCLLSLVEARCGDEALDQHDDPKRVQWALSSFLQPPEEGAPLASVSSAQHQDGVRKAVVGHDTESARIAATNAGLWPEAMLISFATSPAAFFSTVQSWLTTAYPETSTMRVALQSMLICAHESALPAEALGTHWVQHAIFIYEMNDARSQRGLTHMAHALHVHGNIHGACICLMLSGDLLAAASMLCPRQAIQPADKVARSMILRACAGEQHADHGRGSTTSQVVAAFGEAANLVPPIQYWDQSDAAPTNTVHELAFDEHLQGDVHQLRPGDDISEHAGIAQAFNGAGAAGSYFDTMAAHPTWGAASFIDQTLDPVLDPEGCDEPAASSKASWATPMRSAIPETPVRDVPLATEHLRTGEDSARKEPESDTARERSSSATTAEVPSSGLFGSIRNFFSKARKETHWGEASSTKPYYDEAKGTWVFPGEEAQEEQAFAPPPTSVSFATSEARTADATPLKQASTGLAAAPDARDTLAPGAQSMATTVTSTVAAANAIPSAVGSTTGASPAGPPGMFNAVAGKPRGRVARYVSTFK